MVFPNTPLDLHIELQMAGVWTDASTSFRIGSGLDEAANIFRPQRPGTFSAEASTCDLILNNRDGRYSPRNPASEYYGRIGRNTPLRVWVPHAEDTFDGRTSSNGWGTSTSGHAWSTSGGSAADYSVSSGLGRISNGSVNVAREVYLGVSRRDVTVRMIQAVGVVATGGTIQQSIVLRRADASNSILCAVVYATDGTITLSLAARVGGVNTAFAASDTSIPYTASTELIVEASVHGDLVTMWAWDAADPTVYTKVSDRMDADAAESLAAVGAVGVRSFLASTNTNTLPVSTTFEDVSVRWDQFAGEVADWPQRWDVSGRDVWVPLQAAGQYRRLERQDSLKSAMFRVATSRWSSFRVVAYWPGEDKSGSTRVASALGGQPMTHTIVLPSFASGSQFPGSEPLLTLSTGALIGQIPANTNTGTIAFRGLFSVPSGIASNALIADVQQTNASSIRTWRLRHATNGNLQLQAVALDGTVAADSGALGTFDIRGKDCLIGFHVDQSGADVSYSVSLSYLSADDTVVDGGNSGGTFTSLLVGMARTLVIAASGLLTDVAAGHFMVANATDMDPNLDEAINGHAGETAVERMARLCDEEGVLFAARGTSTTLCGPQRVAPLADLLKDAASLDGGIQYEPREMRGVAYRPRESMYITTAAPTPALTLNYAGQEIAPPLEPADDDQQLANDITVTRYDGSSARAVRETGPLNVQDPEDDPEGVGRHAKPLNVNAASDEDLPSLAGWQLHVGTWDEARWPAITVKQARLGLAGKQTVQEAAAAADVGDLLVVENPPSWIPPDDIETLIAGQLVSLNKKRWNITNATTPAGPYRVFVLDDTTLGRLETGGSEMAAQAASGATSLLVKVTGEALWPTGSQDFGIRCSGSAKHVTNIASCLVDSFGRTVSNGWGTPDSTYMGTAYSVEGTASEYSVVGPGTGRMQLVGVNVLHFANVDTGSTDHYVVGGGILGVLPTGNPISMGVAGRQAPGGNYYHIGLLISTAGAVTAQLFKRVNGTGATLSSALTLPVTHSAGNEWRMALDIRGDKIRGKAWRWNMPEPDWQLFATNDELTAGTNIAALGRRETGNTNGSTALDWPDLTVVNPQTFTADSAATNGMDKVLPAGDRVTTARIGALAL